MTSVVSNFKDIALEIDSRIHETLLSQFSGISHEKDRHVPISNFKNYGILIKIIFDWNFRRREYLDFKRRVDI